MKTVFVVEDEVIIRDLIIHLIEAHPELTCIGSNGDGQAALADCIEKKPDLVMLDIRLPKVSGLEILIMLKRKLPDTKVILCSGTFNAEIVSLAIKAGADAMIEKAGGIDDIERAIRAVINGEEYYSKRINQLRLMSERD